MDYSLLRFPLVIIHHPPHAVMISSLPHLIIDPTASNPPRHGSDSPRHSTRGMGATTPHKHCMHPTHQAARNALAPRPRPCSFAAWLEQGPRQSTLHQKSYIQPLSPRRQKASDHNTPDCCFLPPPPVRVPKLCRTAYHLHRHSATCLLGSAWHVLPGGTLSGGAQCRPTHANPHCPAKPWSPLPLLETAASFTIIDTPFIAPIAQFW